MSDIVERLRYNGGPDGNWGVVADDLQIEAANEIERLRIRCDGYQASRDWAITTLAGALHVETDTVRALEYYARFAAEELERLRAQVQIRATLDKVAYPMRWGAYSSVSNGVVG